MVSILRIDQVANIFDKGNECTTATYGDNGDGTLSVHNFCTLNSPTGDASVIEGYVFNPNAAEPGQFTLHLDGTPADATYWVLELGPINSNNQYDYAIVSDSTNKFLYVLTRDMATFESKYETAVLASVKNLGFTGIFTKPVKVCVNCVEDL